MEIAMQPRIHRLARRWSVSGYRGARTFWRLAERVSPWPDAELVRVWPSTVVLSDPTDFIAAGIYRGLYERAEVALLRLLLPPGPEGRFAVDVGANVGYHTAVLSELVGPTGRVLAFEPSRRTYAGLRKVVEGTPLPNVTATRAALGRSRSTLELRDVGGPTNTGLATLRPVGEEGVGERMEDVDVVPLDDVPDVRDADRIDLLKIDVEGFEADVLAGAARTIGDGRVVHALIEVSPQFGPVDYASALLTELGSDYRAYRVCERGRWRRRLGLVPLSATAIGGVGEQFNLLVSRRDAAVDIDALVVSAA